MICKALPFFYFLTGCDTNSIFNGKGKCSFFDNWINSECNDELTNTFVRLGHVPKSIESVDIFIVESLVKAQILNLIGKDQFIQSTSNDLKKLAPSSDLLHMQILRAAHIASFEWLECAQNVLVSDLSLLGFIHKCGVYVPRWLPNPATFDLKGIVLTCIRKKAKWTSCQSFIN